MNQDPPTYTVLFLSSDIFIEYTIFPLIFYFFSEMNYFLIYNKK